jgi:methylphosphotriester-DNA--protein-cysteine methyltransferase
MNEQRFQTTIRVSRATWRQLRRLAEKRAELQGGRPSVSAAIADLALEASKAKRERADA